MLVIDCEKFIVNCINHEINKDIVPTGMYVFHAAEIQVDRYFTICGSKYVDNNGCELSVRTYLEDLGFELAKSGKDTFFYILTKGSVEDLATLFRLKGYKI